MAKIRKTITREWLESEGACEEGIVWWEENGSSSIVETLRAIHTQPSYARWLIERLLVSDKKTAIRLAVFSTRLCLDKYKGDKTPLISAIESAEDVVKNDCKKTRAAAGSAAWVAAWAAGEAAWAAALAAGSAAGEAAGAAGAAGEAACAAARAAGAAAWKNILDELIRLIEEGEL